MDLNEQSRNSQQMNHSLFTKLHHHNHSNHHNHNYSRRHINHYRNRQYLRQQEKEKEEQQRLQALGKQSIVRKQLRIERKTKFSLPSSSSSSSLFTLNTTTIIIILVLTNVNTTQASAACPTKCSCIWKNNKQTAQCVNQGLISIPSGINPTTQVLDLNKNNLQILPNKVFQERGLINLQKIYLSECKLGVISNDSFKQLNNLVELYLSSNLLTTVPSTALRSIQYLRRLLLNNNPIRVIGENCFTGMENLYFIDLSNCQIELIEPTAFSQVDKLQFLKLEGNRLTTLPAQLAVDLPPLYAFDLHKNPWNCDCELRVIIEWMARNRVPQSVPPTCQTPERLDGLMWNSLNINDFACYPIILSRENDLSSSQTANSTFSCTVRAVPEAKVSWQIANTGYGNATYTELYPKMDKYLITRENPEYGVNVLTLNILNVDSVDAKFSFRCLAENEAGAASKVFNLTLLPSSAYQSLSGWTKIEVIGAITGTLLSIVITCVLVAVCVLRKTRNFNNESKQQQKHNQKHHHQQQQSQQNNFKSSSAEKNSNNFNQNEQKIIMDELNKIKSDTGSSSTYGYKPDITVNTVINDSINGDMVDNGYLNTYNGLLQMSPNSQYPHPYSSSHLHSTLPSSINQQQLQESAQQSYEQQQILPQQHLQYINYENYEAYEYDNQGPNINYDMPEIIGLSGPAMVIDPSVAACWSKQPSPEHQQQQQQQQLPESDHILNNQNNVHHVNVIGQGSYSIGQPTVVRYSPDEGYAEEPAVIPYNLQGTEV